MGGARGQVPQRTEGQIPGPAETQEDNNACQRPMNKEKCGVTVHSVCLGPCSVPGPADGREPNRTGDKHLGAQSKGPQIS